MQDVVIVWKEKNYRVEARDVITLICRIEDHLTLNELENFNMRGAVPLGRLAKAYAAALQFAGAPVTEQEVYEQMWEPGKQEACFKDVYGIIQMMIPPKHLQAQGSDTKKKEDSPGSGDGQSKKRSRRRSPGGSAPATSGE